MRLELGEAGAWAWSVMSRTTIPSVPIKKANRFRLALTINSSVDLRQTKFFVDMAQSLCVQVQTLRELL